MIASEYKAQFHEMSQSAMVCVPIEFERICRLVKGFARYLQEVTT